MYGQTVHYWVILNSTLAALAVLLALTPSFPAGPTTRPISEHGMRSRSAALTLLNEGKLRQNSSVRPIRLVTAARSRSFTRASIPIYLVPAARREFWLDDHLFVPGDEIVTYSARSLEPHRGFHIFMRALPSILRRRPRAHVLIVGRGDACYSGSPAHHRSYAERFFAEIENSVDRTRIHFVGLLPTDQYRAVLQISAVHVYLTYPFVLSWSLIEAMATGCVVVGSRTPPVQEVIVNNENGLLVDFFDCERLADQVCYVLARPDRCIRLRAAARETALKKFDFGTICLPAQLRLFQQLTGSRNLRIRCSSR